MNKFSEVLACDYDQAVAIDLYLYSREDSAQRKMRLKRAFAEMIRTPTPSAQSADVLFFQSMRRPDYDEQFRSIAEQVEESSRTVVQVETRASRSLSIKLLWFTFIGLYWAVTRKNRNSPWLLLTLRIAYIARCIDSVLCMDYRMLAVFSDMQPVDNALIQIMHNRGVKTVSMQHGLYIDYESMDTQNKFNYMASNADHLLVWGEETRLLMSKYKPETQVHICGKPGIFQESSSTSVNEAYFSLVFDQNPFHKQNVELLAIATEYARKNDIKLNLRLHPRNNIRWYRIDSDLVIQGAPLQPSKFVLGHTSSMLYELMRLGVPVYRYCTDIPANKQVRDDIAFRDIDQLEAAASSTKTNAEDGAFYIKHVGRKSLQRYAESLNSLLIQTNRRSS